MIGISGYLTLIFPLIIILIVPFILVVIENKDEKVNEEKEEIQELIEQKENLVIKKIVAVIINLGLFSALWFLLSKIIEETFFGFVLIAVYKHLIGVPTKLFGPYMMLPANYDEIVTNVINVLAAAIIVYYIMWTIFYFYSDIGKKMVGLIKIDKSGTAIKTSFRTLSSKTLYYIVCYILIAFTVYLQQQVAVNFLNYIILIVIIGLAIIIRIVFFKQKFATISQHKFSEIKKLLVANKK